MTKTNRIVDVTSVIVVVHFFLSHERARYVTLRYDSFVRFYTFTHASTTYLERGDRCRPMRVLLLMFVFLLRVSRDRNLHVCKQTLLSLSRACVRACVDVWRIVSAVFEGNFLKKIN